jgi:type III restriction enzyme
MPSGSVPTPAKSPSTLVVIDDPILNSPFNEPSKHFKFTEDGITDEVVEKRRSSAYFIPIARPKKKGRDQLEFDTEWTSDRLQENVFINKVRERVAAWRNTRYAGSAITNVSRQLLEHWQA